MSAQSRSNRSRVAASQGTSGPLAETFAPLVSSFLDWVADRPEVAGQVEACCRKVLDAIANDDVTTNAEESAGTASVTLTGPPPRTSSRRRESLGESGKPTATETKDVDLELIVERCRLKGEGSRWAVERLHRIDDGADFQVEVRPHDQQIIQRARDLPSCFLWMNQPRNDIRRQERDFLRAGECFDAMAETLDLLVATLEADDHDRFLAAIDLVAEAQSALRTIVSRVEDYPDSDQQQVYHWLRNRASADQFYISRYMRISDPADPRNAEQVVERAAEIRSALPEMERESILQRNPLMIVQARLDRLHPDPARCTVEQWDDVFDALDEAIASGIAADSPEIRQLLLPRFDDIPDMDVSEQTDQVLLQIERYLDSLADESAA